MQELLQPFRAEPPLWTGNAGVEDGMDGRYENIKSKVTDPNLHQKIVDMLYEVLMFNCNNDQIKAKAMFVHN